MIRSKRQWLNRDQELTSFVAASIDKYEGSLTIADCARQITVHSQTLCNHRTDKVSKKRVKKFKAKLMVIRDMIDWLLAECDAQMED